MALGVGGGIRSSVFGSGMFLHKTYSFSGSAKFGKGQQSDEEAPSPLGSVDRTPSFGGFGTPTSSSGGAPSEKSRPSRPSGNFTPSFGAKAGVSDFTPSFGGSVKASESSPMSTGSGGATGTSGSMDSGDLDLAPWSLARARWHAAFVSVVHFMRGLRDQNRRELEIAHRLAPHMGNFLKVKVAYVPHDFNVDEEDDVAVDERHSRMVLSRSSVDSDVSSIDRRYNSTANKHFLIYTTSVFIPHRPVLRSYQSSCIISVRCGLCVLELMCSVKLHADETCRRGHVLHHRE